MFDPLTGGSADPTFSIIINNYNYDWCLPDAVGSIAAQTFRNFELIIVDDGSTDRSLDYIRSIGLPFKFVASPKLEQARACLLALKEACGEYVYFLDADDIAEPELLERVAETLGSTPSKVQFRMLPIDRNGIPLRAPFPDFPAEYTTAQIRADIRRFGGYTSPPTSGNVFRRDVLLLIDDIDYDRAIDGVTLLLAPYCGPVLTLNVVLARYRVHADSHSAHARPTEVGTILRDRARFTKRLSHLIQLLQKQNLPGLGPRTDSCYLFDIDLRILEAVLSGYRCSPPMAVRFVWRLIRERGFSVYSLRKLGWLLVAVAAPRRTAIKVAASRRTPWGRGRRQNADLRT